MAYPDTVDELTDGVPADGIAGSLTLMAMANGTPGPHLLRVLE